MIAKIKITYIAAIMLVAGALTLQADSHKGGMMSGEGMQAGAKMDKCECMMCGQNMMSMGRCMMNRQIVPTEDGGIVVVMGSYLLKYDADLNLVRKVEIDLGPEDMKMMMNKHKAMHDMMMKGSGSKD